MNTRKMFMQRINIGLYVSACLLVVCWAQYPCSSSGDGAGSSVEQERGCRPGNASTGPLCSNRGNCICGVCECNELPDPDNVISGSFCECDNYSCDRNKGLLCSGPDHGQCVCGHCNCAPGYAGPACDCLIDDTPCRSPDNGKICSGNGRCMCGRCVCDVTSGHNFSGRFCHQCPTCPGRCEEFKECVLCHVHHRGAEWAAGGSCLRACEPDTAASIIVFEGQLIVNYTLNEHLCSFRFEENDGCSYAFAYSYPDYEYPYQSYRLIIKAQKDPDCPKNDSVCMVSSLWVLLFSLYISYLYR